MPRLSYQKLSPESADIFLTQAVAYPYFDSSIRHALNTCSTSIHRASSVQDQTYTRRAIDFVSCFKELCAKGATEISYLDRSFQIVYTHNRRTTYHVLTGPLTPGVQNNAFEYTFGSHAGQTYAAQLAATKAPMALNPAVAEWNPSAVTNPEATATSNTTAELIVEAPTVSRAVSSGANANIPYQITIDDYIDADPSSSDNSPPATPSSKTSAGSTETALSFNNEKTRRQICAEIKARRIEAQFQGRIRRLVKRFNETMEGAFNYIDIILENADDEEEGSVAPYNPATSPRDLERYHRNRQFDTYLNGSYVNERLEAIKWRKETDDAQVEAENLERWLSNDFWDPLA